MSDTFVVNYSWTKRTIRHRGRNLQPNYNMTTILRVGCLPDMPKGETAVIYRLFTAFREPAITDIYFWNIQFTPGIVQALGTLLQHGGRHWNSIKILSCMGLVAEAVSTILSSQRVTALILNGPAFDEPVWKALDEGCKRNHSITMLRLLGVRLWSEKPLKEISIPANLEELDLTRSRLGTMFAVHLAKAVSTSRHLKCVRLDYCSLSEEAMSAILQACIKCGSLQELYLSHSPSYGSSESSINALSTLTKRLRMLDVRCQQFNIMTASWSPLFASLNFSTTLQRLDISGNKLTDRDLLLLVISLKGNTTLQSLNLRYCQLSEQAIQILASSLPYLSKNLTILDLSGITYREKSAMSLAQGLQHNYVLQELGTLRYSCSTARIEYYLDCNWGGRRALQEEDEKPIPLGLWAHILARINRLPLRQTTGMRYLLPGRRESVLFSMLRGGPALLER
jgi:hypothetical protein